MSCGLQCGFIVRPSFLLRFLKRKPYHDIVFGGAVLRSESVASAEPVC